MRKYWVVHSNGQFLKVYLKRVVSYRRKLYSVTIIRAYAHHYKLLQNARKAAMAIHGVVETVIED